MESEFLNWMIAEVSVLGLPMQNWMLVFAACFLLYGFVSALKRERRH